MEEVLSTEHMCIWVHDEAGQDEGRSSSLTSSNDNWFEDSREDVAESLVDGAEDNGKDNCPLNKVVVEGVQGSDEEKTIVR